LPLKKAQLSKPGVFLYVYFGIPAFVQAGVRKHGELSESPNFFYHVNTIINRDENNDVKQVL